MVLGQRRDRTNQRKKLFGAIALGTVGLLLIIHARRSQAVVSPLPQSPPLESRLIMLFAPKKDPTDLRQKIEKITEGKWRNYSVMVESYTQNFSLAINDTAIYPAASVNKIPILAALYYYAQTGDIDLGTIVTLQQDDIQDYGTGSIRYDPPGTTYSIKTLAKLMMQQSDNTAAFLIANYTIGLDKIQKLMDSWGLTQTSMVDNTTSNKDMARLLKKMYQEQVTNHALTQEMLGFMKDTDFEDRIPALLPKIATVYHKIGNAPSGIHDVGLVQNDKTTYYIGIFSLDITDEQEASKTAALISKTVYDYLK